MSIILTDEEIMLLIPAFLQWDADCGEELLSVRDAQLKKVVEWLLDNELIPSYKGDFVIPNEKFKALLKEVE